MKFILNEKFILDERFILTEADEKISIDSLKKDISTLINGITNANTINKLKMLLGGNNDAKAENESNKIIDAGQKVIDQFDAGQKDVNIIKGAITEYLKLIQTAISKSSTSVGSALNSLSGIKNLIIKLQADLDKTPMEEADKEKLIVDIKTNFSRLSSIVEQGLSDNASTPTDGDAYSEEIDQAVENIVETRNKIAGINKEADSISAGLQKFKAELEENNKTLAKYLKEKGGEDAYDTLLTIAEQCQKLSELFNFNAISDTKNDWAKEFEKVQSSADPKQINKVWDNYYKTEWGKDAEKVKALGQTFVTELLKGGFSEQVNPFVVFIKNNINRLNLNASTYPAVHNAYVSDYISQSDLRNNENNLLYNKSLYSKQAKDIYEYLSYQYKIFNNFNNIEDDLKDIYKNKWELAAAIFDSSVNITANSFPKADTADLRNISTLKTLDQIKTCMDLCFKNKNLSQSDEKPDITAEKLAKEIIAAGIGSEKDSIKKAIMQLAIKANNKALVDYVIAKKIGMASDLSDMTKLENIFSNYSIKGVKKLIKDLAISSEIANEEDLKD